MSKTAKIIHRILQVLLLGGLVCEFVFFLMHWGSLPEQPGIHFDHDGNFDVYASKIYGFYPHLISLIVIAADIVLTWIVAKEKLKLGLKVNEKGKRLIISSIVITLDIAAIAVVLCFCFWVYAVSKQSPKIMDNGPMIIFECTVHIVLAAVIFQCIVNRMCREKTESVTDLTPGEKRKRNLRFLLTGSAEKPEPGKHHGLIRVASWLIVGMMLAIMSFVIERLPHDDIADNYHGLAYFANFGDYYAKWLVFLPFIVMVPFMALFEFIGIRSMKKGRLHLTVLADRLKMIFAVFGGWWEIILGSEQPISIVSVCIFALLCIMTYISYFIKNRN